MSTIPVREEPIRREPPPFRRLEVVRVAARTPYLRKVTLAGPELRGFEPPEPAGSVRLLVGEPTARGALEVPRWNGNEYLFADGTRPPIRTLTPLRFAPDVPELDVEVVRHGSGLLSDWVDTVQPGAPVALSGPGRGYRVDPDARTFLIAGDESALPAIGQVLAALPSTAEVTVVAEVREPAARPELPARSGLQVTWVTQVPDAPPGTALADAVSGLTLADDVVVWAAGEAASMQRIRRHLFEDLGVVRSRATVRGYWKHGRSGGGGN